MANNFEKPSMGPEVPPKPETPEEKPPLGKFEETFKIKPEELESIEGYKDLSVGKRALALENFQSLTVKAIESKAIEQIREETAKAGFGGRIWHGIFRKYYSAKAEKLNADNILNGGIKMHREALAEIVRETKESGLDAEWDEKEKKIKILYAGRFENLSPEEEKNVAKFNQAADKFTRASSGWRYSKREKNKFAKLENEYKNTLAGLGEIVKKKESSKTDNERLAEFNTFKYLADVDKKVHLTQFLSSNPGACKELERIQSQSVWAKALRNTFFEKGGYMAMGFAARTVTVNLLGLVAAPLAAAGIGGWIARNRTVETLREEAKLAESGKKHSELITAVRTENLEKKIDMLLEQIENADGYERIAIGRQLDIRLNYTRYKLESGLVQYGQGAEKLKNQYSLLQKLSEAEVVASLYGSQKEKVQKELKPFLDVQQKIEERLGDWLKFKERKVEKHVKEQVTRGAIMGAGFAVLGYGIRDLYEKLGIDLGIERTIKGFAGDVVGRVKEVLTPESALKVPPDVPADSLINVPREKFPLFAQDTTFRTDSSGVITREGYPGTYSIDKTTGDLIYSGGTKPDGSEFPPQVLKVGSAAAEQWVEAPPGTGIKPEQFEYRGGKSIWQETEKQWEARFKEFADLGGGDSKTAEALRTYNIDRIKDTVVNAIKSGNKDLIEKYGLTGISDPDKLTIDQLKGIKFNNVFEDTLKGKGLVENLSPEQIENITKNNATLREFFEKYPKAPRISANYEDILRGKGDISVPIDDIEKNIKVGKIPVEEITTKRVTGTGIPVAGTAEHIPLTHGEIISNLQESLPRMEETADQFGSLSMLEQEQILHSPKMQMIEDSMRQFRALGNITDSDAALMGQVNESWGDMTSVYQENLEAFTDAVRESTGLNDVGLEKLLGTKITDIWTAFEGKEKIFDFLKTVNPTSDELVEKLTVGEILKSRFTDGKFGGLVDKVLGEGWKE